MSKELRAIRENAGFADENALDKRVDTIRRFNRFYTKQIGVLREGLLGSPFSLTQVRLLHELSHRQRPTATELCKELGLDPGYLSRMVRSFEHRGFVKRTASQADGRQSHLSLTKEGQAAYVPLDAAAREEVRAMLVKLSGPEQKRLVEALETAHQLWGAEPERNASYVLRLHRPGDMGWVVHRHGVLYAQEYGWNEEFEALVAEIVAKFIRSHDSKRERCWIAEKDGEVVGSVFLVKHSKTIGQLRLLLLEPSARGLGIGARLVDECTRFARQVGYRKIVLWTNGVLRAARRIYQKAGYRLLEEKPHHSFGVDLVGQTWELKL
jgi:DNA-binding MarR family transcriptional regulator/GNAT superfamily N-acetyltransferase